MRWIVRIPVSLVIIATLGCSPSGSTRPSEVPAADTQQRATWLTDTQGHVASAGLRSTAVIDGFRVHPDPDDNGVIHVFEGENVVVNATDIASRPPAPQSYLVVNWGDGANQRVGCGPCRQDHGYTPGRYTLLASLDGTAADRSISLAVEVSVRREKSDSALAPIQPFELSSSDIAVGETTFLLLPEFLPSDVEVDVPSFVCSPPNAAFADFANVVDIPPNIALPFIGVLAGTCTFSVSGTVGGTPFTQSATFTIH